MKLNDMVYCIGVLLIIMGTWKFWY